MTKSRSTGPRELKRQIGWLLTPPISKPDWPERHGCAGTNAMAIAIARVRSRTSAVALGVARYALGVEERRERGLDERSWTGKIRIMPWSLPKLIRVGVGLRRAVRNQSFGAESPEIVMFDERSSELLERARELAADDREDHAAVGELRALAGKHTRALGVAALGARQWGQHRESSVDNLAHRLLQAALNDTALEPLAAEEKQRLEQIDAFNELPPMQAWRLLVEHEPRLAALEEEVRAGQYGHAHPNLGALSPEERRQAAREELDGMTRLDEQLKPLVGPDADTSNLLVATRVALEIAHQQLTVCSPGWRATCSLTE